MDGGREYATRDARVATVAIERLGQPIGWRQTSYLRPMSVSILIPIRQCVLYFASTVAFIPPRTLNSPQTKAQTGRQAAAKSLRIRLTAFS